jgi:hypothetical protein
MLLQVNPKPDQTKPVDVSLLKAPGRQNDSSVDKADFFSGVPLASEIDVLRPALSALF